MRQEPCSICAVFLCPDINMKRRKRQYTAETFILLHAGEEKRVLIPIPKRAFECVTDDGRRIKAGRHFRLYVGGSQPDAASVRLMGKAPAKVEYTVE